MAAVGSTTCAHRGTRVTLVHPGAPRSRSGNRVTALRWACILRGLGCSVRVERTWSGAACDILIAIHAAKTLDAIRRAQDHGPDLRIVVACAGTDIYGENAPTPETLEGIQAAFRVVVLQPLALDALPPAVRPRARVIYQSVVLPQALFDSSHVDDPTPDLSVAVVANVRPVKDPLTVVRATERLPASSRLVIQQAGAAIDAGLARQLEDRARNNPRYSYLGELGHRAALELVARSRLLVLSSRHEGGANVLSEALAMGVPVLCTDIPGNAGLLGKDYAGLFPVGDAATLAHLLERFETDSTYRSRLRAQVQARAWIAQRSGETKAWSDLLDELASPDAPD